MILEERSPNALEMMVDEAPFSRNEILGLAPSADATSIRQAMGRLALVYHPDKGSTQQRMSRINAAYEQARVQLESRRPTEKTPPRP